MHTEPVDSIARGVLRAAVLAATLLAVPLVASRVVEGWNWSPGDFVFAGILFFGAGLTYQLIVARSGSVAYRVGAGLAVAGALALVWVNLAVGFIGEPANPANLIYAGVLLVGAIGAAQARLQPAGMAVAMAAAAGAQALVAGFVLVGGLAAPGPALVLFAHGIFVALFLTSSLLFWIASQQQRSASDAR